MINYINLVNFLKKKKNIRIKILKKINKIKIKTFFYKMHIIIKKINILILKKIYKKRKKHIKILLINIK